ncbi:MAG: hypothetical protein R2748_10720 [Bryobacterales bacterium]
MFGTDPRAVEAALEGAGKARGATPGLRFPESTLWLMARVAAKQAVRLDALEGWLGEALAEVEREAALGGASSSSPTAGRGVAGKLEGGGDPRRGGLRG